MIVPVYTPGDWVAVVTDGAVALLPPTIDEDRLTQVWDALRESSDLTHSLTVLARGGLVGLPPFALVSVVDGHVRGFLRGDVRLFTAGADGTHEHSAVHVATWAEINVAGAGAVTVAVPAQVAPDRRDPRMPALAAVVRASSVEVSLRAGVEAPSPVPPVREPVAGAPAASETTTKDGLEAEVLDAEHLLDPSIPVPGRAARRALVADQPDVGAPTSHAATAPAAPQPSPDPVRDAERAREYVARRARATSAQVPLRDRSSVPDAAPATSRRTGYDAARRAEPVVLPAASTTSASPLVARAVEVAPPPPPEAPVQAVPAVHAAPLPPVTPSAPSAPAALGPAAPARVAFDPALVDPTFAEMTVVPTLEPEPVALELTGPDVAALVDDDDRYGSTVLSTSLVEIRRQMNDREPEALPGPFPVPAVPRVHKIRMSSGLLVPLDRAVLIGRAPVVSRVAARDLPRLVTVVSPNQDISRTHAQVHTDGEDVLVTDLNSTNGMLLTEAGHPPRRLRSGEPTPIAPGALVDLGDGVTFTLERDR